jgi:hypothetical protein
MPVPLEYAHTGPVAPAAPGPEGLVTLIRDRAEFFARVEAYGTQFGEEQRADAPDDGSGAGGGTLTLRGRSGPPCRLAWSGHASDRRGTQLRGLGDLVTY